MLKFCLPDKYFIFFDFSRIIFTPPIYVQTIETSPNRTNSHFWTFYGKLIFAVSLTSPFSPPCTIPSNHHRFLRHRRRRRHRLPSSAAPYPPPFPHFLCPTLALARPALVAIIWSVIWLSSLLLFFAASPLVVTSRFSWWCFLWILLLFPFFLIIEMFIRIAVLILVCGWLFCLFLLQDGAGVLA